MTPKALPARQSLTGMIHPRRSDRSGGRARVSRAAAVALAAASSALVLPTSPAHGVTGGTLAPDTAAQRSTVYLSITDNGGGSACTGTLVAADLVVTAGHCVNHAAPNPPPHTPYGQLNPGWGDWENPGQWYPLYQLQAPGEGVQVRLGVDSSRPVLTVRATSYAIPNNADVLLLRLAQGVPATAAQPVPVLTRTPAIDPTTFWQDQTFTRAGFGGTTLLRTGAARSGTFPCPRSSGGWVFGDSHKICVLGGSDGSATVPGDSGGPLFWTDPVSGVRHLVGVFQGVEQQNGGRYGASFYPGGLGFDGGPRPDLRRFFEQALGTTRNVDVTVSMRIVDHETFASNEVRNVSFNPLSVTLRPWSSRLAYSACAGGEVRGELKVTARSSDAVGTASVLLDGSLFEGSSCSTTDRDGGPMQVSTLVAANGSVTREFTVRNTDEGGDYVTFTVTIVNRPS